MKKEPIKKLHEEFIKKYPNPNDRASIEAPWGAIYVHWLEEELLKLRSKRPQ
jgi:hypothetical protein